MYILVFLMFFNLLYIHTEIDYIKETAYNVK